MCMYAFYVYVYVRLFVCSRCVLLVVAVDCSLYSEASVFRNG